MCADNYTTVSSAVFRLYDRLYLTTVLCILDHSKICITGKIAEKTTKSVQTKPCVVSVIASTGISAFQYLVTYPGRLVSSCSAHIRALPFGARLQTTAAANPFLDATSKGLDLSDFSCIPPFDFSSASPSLFHVII